LVDESVFYIQGDYAGDPRQFYFGTKRDQRIQTQATMNQKSYAKLVPGEKDELIDEWEKERRLSQAREEWAPEGRKDQGLYFADAFAASRDGNIQQGDRSDHLQSLFGVSSTGPVRSLFASWIRGCQEAFKAGG